MATNTVPRSTLRGAIVSALGFSLESTVINSVRDDYTFGGFGVEAFTPEDLFKSGEQGAWYDFSDLATMFQDSTGTIPVTDVEQPVGLVLDKRLGLVLGAELVTNGDFSNGTTGWTSYRGGILSVTNEELTVTSPGGNFGSATQTLTLTTGKWYRIDLSLITFTGTGAGPNVRVGTTLGGTEMVVYTFTTTGAKYVMFQATATTGYFVLWNSDTTGGTFTTWDNVSVKELPGNHAIQATAAARPVLSARKNLYDRTEELDNVVWAKENVTITANAVLAPDGMMTADKMVETATNTSHNYFRTMSGLATTRYTVSEYAKAGERTEYALLGTLAGSPTINVNLVDGSVIFASTPGVENFAYTITNAGDGWWRISLSVDIPATTFTVVGFITINNGTSVYLGDANKGLYLWGRELTTSPTATRYQRVNTDTDYDSSGFPHYANSDGVDDFMSAIGAVSWNSMLEVIGFSGGGITGFTIDTGTANATRLILDLNNASRVILGAADGSTAAADYGNPPTPLGVYTAIVDSPMHSVEGRKDGVSVGGGQTTGTNVSTFKNIGLFAANASANFSNMNVYQLVILGRTPTSEEINKTEQFIASKTGVTTTSRSDAEEQKRLP